MFSSLLVASILSLALPLASANPHGSTHQNRHAEVAKRQVGDVELHKRFGGSRWSFYDVGQGACGKVNSENDFIVALNTPQYGGGYPGPNCFKTITMTYNGKTAQATIMDQCPGCPFGGLDLSRGLFRFFAPESAGIITGSWSFNGEGEPAPPPPPPPPAPKTTKEWVPPVPITTWKPEPTTTWKPEPTTTWTPEPTTTKASTTLSISSSSSSTQKSSTVVSTTSTAPSVVPTPAGPKILNLLDRIVINLGGIVIAGAVNVAV